LQVIILGCCWGDWKQKFAILLASQLGGTNKFANFFEVEIPVVFRRYFFLDKGLYLQNHPPKEKGVSMKERASRFQRLMDENGWTRVELARQLGVSRAWVNRVLRAPSWFHVSLPYKSPPRSEEKNVLTNLLYTAILRRVTVKSADRLISEL